MKKALVIGLIGAIALVIVAKKTNVCSYASTLVSQVERDAKKQIPTKFEIERIRNEIANLDADVSQMIRPIAEYKADIEKLRKEISQTQRDLEKKNADLIVVVDKIQDVQGMVVLAGRKHPVEKVRQQVQRETDHLKLMEKNIAAQQQVLEAKENSLKATQEQLAKVISLKREFEVRLAQLEAMDQTIQVSRIASNVKIDTSRATKIQHALQGIEHKLQADMHELDLRKTDGNAIDLYEPESETLDLQAISNYLRGTEPAAKTASK
jgi:chromosome segregation ATPase